MLGPLWSESNRRQRESIQSNLTVYFWHSNSLKTCLMQNFWPFRAYFKELYSLKINSEIKDRDENLCIIQIPWLERHGHFRISINLCMDKKFTFKSSCPGSCLYFFAELSNILPFFFFVFWIVSRLLQFFNVQPSLCLQYIC